jgi:hypothetical protein
MNFDELIEKLSRGMERLGIWFCVLCVFLFEWLLVLSLVHLLMNLFMHGNLSIIVWAQLILSFVITMLVHAFIKKDLDRWL